MAAKTIKNFLVGLGLDVDEKSFAEAETGLDMIGKKALQMGAAVAGAFGAKALTFDFAMATDQLGKFSQFLQVSADDVNAYGGAIEQNGGSLQGFMSQLQGIAQIQAGMLVGDFSFVEALGRLRIPREQVDSFRNAQGPIEAYLSLADMLRDATAGQRLGIANALGLDQASVLLLSRGREEVEKLVEAQRRMQPITQKMTEQAADFNDNIQELSRNLSGLANIFSSEFMESLNETLDNINELFDENRNGTRGVAATAAKRTVEAGAAGAELVSFLPMAAINDELTGESISESLGIIVKPIANIARDLVEHFGLPTGGVFSGSDERTPTPIPAGPASQISLSPTFTILLDGDPIRAIVRDVNGQQAKQTLKDLKRSAD